MKKLMLLLSVFVSVSVLGQKSEKTINITPGGGFVVSSFSDVEESHEVISDIAGWVRTETKLTEGLSFCFDGVAKMVNSDVTTDARYNLKYKVSDWTFEAGRMGSMLNKVAPDIYSFERQSSSIAESFPIINGQYSANIMKETNWGGFGMSVSQKEVAPNEYDEEYAFRVHFESEGNFDIVGYYLKDYSGFLISYDEEYSGLVSTAHITESLTSVFIQSDILNELYFSLDYNYFRGRAFGYNQGAGVIELKLGHPLNLDMFSQEFKGFIRMGYQHNPTGNYLCLYVGLGIN